MITQDLDFSDLRQFKPGTHCGILLIRMSAPGRNALLSQVLKIFKNEAVESWHRCFVVVTDNKIRVKTPLPPFEDV